MITVGIYMLGASFGLWDMNPNVIATLMVFRI